MKSETAAATIAIDIDSEKKKCQKLLYVIMINQNIKFNYWLNSTVQLFEMCTKMIKIKNRTRCLKKKGKKRKRFWWVQL